MNEFDLILRFLIKIIIISFNQFSTKLNPCLLIVWN